jgi:hypothetical protein
MVFAHRVSLDGVQLDDVDERIVVQGVESGTGKDSLQLLPRAVDGQRLSSSRRDSLDISVKFSILLRKYQMAERVEVLEKVNAWAAAGGMLRVGHKEGRRIRVILAQAPGEGDPWAYDTVYTITFRAVGIPYWEEDTAVQGTSGEGASGSIVLQVAGSAKTVADVTLENRSGAVINTATVTAGSSRMNFTGLSMAGGESLVIDHDSEGLIRIRIRSASGSWRSILGKRTVDSADDLFLMPGTRTVNYTAQRACQMTAGCRGRFL